ncbi:Uu.00g002420.m01.CDS01 [Anthostomella pinea]|uniref:Uu.00g002420.m01.CDS01 n=1 Tax=Anthostomella pinea TaxID=933095 RepID=A0AAI8VK64_9PEZI|nr:Uu.00g002420.m01.CDS01 [Anthostomella pinea]
MADHQVNPQINGTHAPSVTTTSPSLGHADRLPPRSLMAAVSDVSRTGSAIPPSSATSIAYQENAVSNSPMPTTAHPELAHRVLDQPPPPPYQEHEPPKADIQGDGRFARPIALNSLGRHPALIDCPWCNQTAQTRTEEEHSAMTFIAGIGLGLICICCACLPCLAHVCQDVNHFCSNCGHQVAHVPFSGVCQPVVPVVRPAGYEMVPLQPYSGRQIPPPRGQTGGYTRGK